MGAGPWFRPQKGDGGKAVVDAVVVGIAIDEAAVIGEVVAWHVGFQHRPEVEHLATDAMNGWRIAVPSAQLLPSMQRFGCQAKHDRRNAA